MELLRLGAFLAFVALGWRARRSPGPARRRAVQQLIGATLALALLPGLLQRDAWPFTSHTIAVGRARADSRVCQTQLFGIDEGGGAWRLDPYTFTPVYDSILQYWMERGLPALTADERAQALGFLLARAEESRRALAAGRAIGPQRRLGPLGAPYWLLLPRQTAVPDAPYTAVRAESACWTVGDGPDAPARAPRQRTAEWPPGPERR